MQRRLALGTIGFNPQKYSYMYYFFFTVAQLCLLLFLSQTLCTKTALKLFWKFGWNWLLEVRWCYWCAMFIRILMFRSTWLAFCRNCCSFEVYFRLTIIVITYQVSDVVLDAQISYVNFLLSLGWATLLVSLATLETNSLSAILKLKGQFTLYKHSNLLHFIFERKI